MKRFISFSLILSVIFTIFSPFSLISAVSDSIASLGYITSLSQELLSFGLVYTELSAKKDNNQKAYIFEYTPNVYTKPQVEYGSNTSTKVRLKDITSRYEKDGQRVVGAMNGDFFSIQTGIPLGVVMKNGELISSDPSKNAIGFTEDGYAFIGNPDVHFTFTCTRSKTDSSKDSQKREPYSFSLDYFNKYPSVYALYFLNDAYSKTTRSTSPSTEIILKPLAGKPIPNSKMTFEVEKIHLNAMDTEIPEGYYVLCGDDRSFAEKLLPVKEGDILELMIDAKEPWDRIDTALGGGDIIVENGVFMQETVDEYHEKTSNPRTAIGIRENGEVVFFANDGRDSNNAVGVTIATLADIMIELGCSTVINLDGGGSTTVYAATPFDATSKLVNNPSDGSERYVSNAILFLNNMPRDLQTGGVKITTDCKYVMLGSSVELEAIYHDKSYRPFTPDTETVFREQPISKQERGIFEGNVFTALKAGNTTLAAVNGDTKGLIDITILSEPDKLVYEGGEISLKVGESVPLDIRAFYENEEVIFNNLDLLNYRFKEKEDADAASLSNSDIGRIENNSFCADKIFVGFLELSAGDASVNIPIKILPESYKKMIGNSSIMAIYTGGQADVINSKIQYLDKAFIELSFIDEKSSDSGVLILKCGDYILDSDAKSVTFFTRNVLDTPSIVLADENGNNMSVPYIIERDYGVFKGWYKYKADLSVIDSETQEQLKISQLLNCVISPNTKIVIGDFAEITAKETIFEDIENSWAKEYIIDVYYQELIKGKPYYTGSVFDGESPLTRAEFATILCRFLGLDTSIYGGSPLDFEDIDTVGDWAWNAISAVNELGLMSGSIESDGKRYFRPNEGISRAETMQVIGRLLNDSESYDELTFNDTQAVPEWAKQNTAKVVSYGIISGYEDNTIRPFNKLTRNEAAKILSLFNTQSFYELLKSSSQKADK